MMILIMIMMMMMIIIVIIIIIIVTMIIMIIMISIIIMMIINGARGLGSPSSVFSLTELQHTEGEGKTNPFNVKCLVLTTPF